MHEIGKQNENGPAGWQLERIVEELRAARSEWRSRSGRPREQGGRELPSRRSIEEIVERLASALFPMRLGPNDLRDESEDFFVGRTLDSALNALLIQARLELRYSARQRGEAEDGIEERALGIVRDFALALPLLRQLLDSDVLAAYQGDPAARSVDEVLLCYPGVLAIIHHRMAHHLYRAGLPLVARIISELAHSATGIDIHALIEHRKKAGTINGFSEAEAADKDEILTRDCEILIPAATENVITSRNADRIRAKILCEGANGPTTPAADAVLADKKTFIIPDILANAGGVTTSYFEWVQHRMGYFWTEAEVNQRLDHIMTESFRDVVTYAQNHSVNNRIAAYMLAIDRVAYTTRQRGMYA